MKVLKQRNPHDNVLKIYESSYMENNGYKPLQINVLFDFSSINPHKKSHVFVITKL